MKFLKVYKTCDGNYVAYVRKFTPLGIWNGQYIVYFEAFGTMDNDYRGTNEFYSRAKRTLKEYKENKLDLQFVFERGTRYRNQFKGYLQSMEDLELITEEEYIDYLNVFYNEINEILGDI